MPEPTVIRTDIRDQRFQPDTPSITLKRVTVERVDFTGLRFVDFDAQKCRFVDCDFSRVQVEWLPFANGGSLFQRCSFAEARIADFGRARFEGCNFANADLEGWFTWAADVVDCRFAGRVTGVVFSGADTDGTRREFRGNDFREADLDDVAFRNGIDLDAQLLPDGPEYIRLRDMSSRIERARRDVEAWSDEEAREVALQMLGIAGDVFEWEPDVFTKREFVVSLADDPEIGLRVLELLELRGQTP
jgi:hypothetical protein